MGFYLIICELDSISDELRDSFYPLKLGVSDYGMSAMIFGALFSIISYFFTDFIFLARFLVNVISVSLDFLSLLRSYPK